MGYADGEVLTMEGRSRRGLMRRQAAKMFANDVDARQVAVQLPVKQPLDRVELHLHAIGDRARQRADADFAIGTVGHVGAAL